MVSGTKGHSVWHNNGTVYYNNSTNSLLYNALLRYL